MLIRVLRVILVAVVLIAASPLFLVGCFVASAWQSVLDGLSEPHVDAASKGDLPALERLLARKPWRFQIQEAVFWAIWEKQADALKLLFERGRWPIHAEVEWLGTALHLAAVRNDPVIIDAVLSYGADPNLKYPDWNPRTPLGWAADHGCIEAVDHLLKHGADPYGIEIESIGKWPPLKGFFTTRERIEAVKERVQKAREGGKVE